LCLLPLTLKVEAAVPLTTYWTSGTVNMPVRLR
jgi:hypothetical protein